MTTYHSQAVTTKDRDGNELTFKTLNLDGEEAVLAAAVDVELPDGQQVTVNVLYDSEDVAGLQAYLHDNFGGRGAGVTRLPESAEETVRAGVHNLLAQGYGIIDPQGNHLTATHFPSRLLPEQDGPTFTESANGPVINFGGQTFEPHAVTEKDLAAHQAGFEVAGIDYSKEKRRQCAHISNGIQCTYAEHSSAPHSYETPGRPDWQAHQDSLPVFPQNDAGATTPPADAQGVAQDSPQPVSAGQSAAESATAVSAAEAAPASQSSDEKPKRKRRLKTEIAFDAAKDEYDRAAYNGTIEEAAAASNALAVAREALRAKDPGNSRLIGVLPAADDPQFPQPAPLGVQEPAPVGFAPEQQPVTNPFEQSAPAANYAQQMASPINQEFATWASNLPGEHHQDSVFMTPEQAATVPAFQPGQAQQLGQVQVSPEEQQAAQGFPCPVQSSDNRPCLRPYGHELQTQTNPEPKPHVYATIDPSSLGQPQPAPVTDPLPWTPQPAGLVPPAAVPQIFQPSGHLSFQVPPTPEAAPHPETNFQPPAPAAPSWSAPV